MKMKQNNSRKELPGWANTTVKAHAKDCPLSNVGRGINITNEKALHCSWSFKLFLYNFSSSKFNTYMTSYEIK